MSIERRSLALSEVKFASEDGTMTFEGYASVFGGVDSYGDRIQKGAYKTTLKEYRAAGRLPPMLAQHGSMLGGDDNLPVGKWLEMREDDTGLFVRGQLADTQRGRDVYTLLKMGAVSGLSIGFQPIAWKMGTKPGEPYRTLTEIKLFEVSIVAVPADDAARIASVKSSLDARIARAIEDDLRKELGLSGSAAVSAVAILKKHLREGGVLAPDNAARDEPGMGDLAVLLRRNINLIEG